MTPRRKRMALVFGIIAGVGIAGALALSAFRQNVTFFFDPTAVTSGQVPAGERFRKLLERPGILPIPGAHCGLAAIQARLAQFEAVYLSGAAMSASMGLPDLGILTIDDVCFFIRQIARAGELPVRQENRPIN